VVDASLIRRVLGACAIAPGQRLIGRSALVRLQALDLTILAEMDQFTTAVSLESKWLPGVQGASPILLSFRELSRHLAAARSSANAYYQLSHLERSKGIIVGLKNQLLSETPYVDAVRATFEQWQRTTDLLYCKAKTDAGAGQARSSGSIDLPDPCRLSFPSIAQQAPRTWLLAVSHSCRPPSSTSSGTTRLTAKDSASSFLSTASFTATSEVAVSD
jgi:hypothetical protein